MEPLSSWLEIFFMLSVPENAIGLWMALLLLGIRLNRPATTIAAAAFAMSLLQDINFLVLPTPVYNLYSTLVVLLVTHFVVRRLRLLTRIGFAIIFIAVCIATELLAMGLASLFIDPDLIRIGPAAYKLLYAWPLFGADIALCLLMTRKKWYPGLMIARYMSMAKDPSFLVFSLLLLIQLMMLATHQTVLFVDKDRHASSVFFFAGIVISLLVTLSSLQLIIRSRERATDTTRSIYLSDLIALFDSLRKQRHDFLNHVQVMYALLSMQRYGRLTGYIEELAEDIRPLDVLIERMPLEALDALVNARAAHAEERKIVFETHTPEQIGHLEASYIADLVRIAGVLIDLAFDKAVDLPASRRRVLFRLSADENGIAMEVATPNDTRSAEIRENPSLLQIARERIGRHKGSLRIEDGEMLRFSALLPYRGGRVLPAAER